LFGGEKMLLAQYQNQTKKGMTLHQLILYAILSATRQEKGEIICNMIVENDIV
jgi:hypothetical protein